MRVSIEKRTKRKHPYFFITSDKSPMWVVRVDGKTVWVANSKAEAIRESNKIRRSR